MAATPNHLQPPTNTNTNTRAVVSHDRPASAHPFYAKTTTPLNNPNLLPSSGRGYLNRHRPSTPFVYSHPEPDFTTRPVQQQHRVSRPGVMKPMAGAPSIIETNGHSRDRNRDANLVVIRDRKVRVHDNVSLYSVCRSWLRNGFPEETQPRYQGAANSLPSPLPLPEKVVNSPDKNEGHKEEDEEDERFSENLSTEELLRSHVKRAKRIRSRLREERAERINRYKTRLGLLLPPVLDQNMRNETN